MYLFSSRSIKSSKLSPSLSFSPSLEEKSLEEDSLEVGMLSSSSSSSSDSFVFLSSQPSMNIRLSALIPYYTALPQNQEREIEPHTTQAGLQAHLSERHIGLLDLCTSEHRASRSGYACHVSERSVQGTLALSRVDRSLSGNSVLLQEKERGAVAWVKHGEVVFVHGLVHVCSERSSRGLGAGGDSREKTRWEGAGGERGHELWTS